LSGVLDFEVVKKALLLGASDYLPKSLEAEEIHHSIQRALHQRTLLMKSSQQATEAKRIHKKHSLIGSSDQMESIRKMIAKIRLSTANVVIYGETGSGKEVVARLLRNEREDGSLCPFVSIDSATIHRETAESVLFGHEKGAFTGADRPRKGIFEEADGGIVYFDELANMTLEIQSKLLRVLEEKEVMRLGSSRTIPVSFRVVCASNKNLEALVRAGALKEDLYQRLTVLPINIPPLRDRLRDIPELVDYFCGIHAIGNRHLSFTREALDVLCSFSWPGNVRELSNLVAYLYAMKEDDVVDVADLPSKIKMMMDAAPPAARRQSFYERMESFEKRLLIEEFEACGGNISKMAQMLGIDRSHLYTKLKSHGIQRSEAANPLQSQI
jgi:DNA-binding NtrC family response regulator